MQRRMAGAGTSEKEGARPPQPAPPGLPPSAPRWPPRTSRTFVFEPYDSDYCQGLPGAGLVSEIAMTTLSPLYTAATRIFDIGRCKLLQRSTLKTVSKALGPRTIVRRARIVETRGTRREELQAESTRG